jgi:predicted nucleic acid-binding protein
MTSINADLLISATNLSCPEHRRARALLEIAVRNPRNWTIADEVLFESYRLARSPQLIENPLSAEDAGRHLPFFREQVGWRHCTYERECWGEAAGALAQPGLGARRTFDLVRAVTLRRNGVDSLCTRNPAAFAGFGRLHAVDPLA